MTFSIGTTIFNPGEVLTLMVAPVVVLALVAAVRWTSWGLAMRAMSENADSARLSGVWIRRTSTLTWTVAGALSAFTVILNALSQQQQVSSLFEVLSPDLLLFALTAALVGAMVNLTVAFLAGVGVGIFYELLQWNTISSNNATAVQVLIFFALILVVLLIRVGATRRSSRGPSPAWSQSAVTVAGRRTRRPLPATGAPNRRLVLAVIGAALLPLVLNVGRTFLFSQICIYAVIAQALTVLTGWAGQARWDSSASSAVGALMAAHGSGTSLPLPLLLLFAGAVTAVMAVLIGLPALRMPGLFLAVSTLGSAPF